VALAHILGILDFTAFFEDFRRVFLPYLGTLLRRVFCIYNVFGTVVFIDADLCICTSPVYCIGVGVNLYFVDMCIHTSVVFVSVWVCTHILCTCIYINVMNAYSGVV